MHDGQEFTVADNVTVADAGPVGATILHVRKMLLLPSIVAEPVNGIPVAVEPVTVSV